MDVTVEAVTEKPYFVQNVANVPPTALQSYV